MFVSGHVTLELNGVVRLLRYMPTKFHFLPNIRLQISYLLDRKLKLTNVDLELWRLFTTLEYHENHLRATLLQAQVKLLKFKMVIEILLLVRDIIREIYYLEWVFIEK